MYTVFWVAYSNDNKSTQGHSIGERFRLIDDAMIAAEVAAIDHSELLGVPYAKHTAGFYICTNNGADVWYMVKKVGSC